MAEGRANRSFQYLREACHKGGHYFAIMLPKPFSIFHAGLYWTSLNMEMIDNASNRNQTVMTCKGCEALINIHYRNCHTPSRQKQVCNRRTVRTILSPTMTTTGGQSGPCLLGSLSFSHCLSTLQVNQSCSSYHLHYG